MRSLGQNPSDSELQDMISGVNAEIDGKVGLPKFLVMMAQKVKIPDPQEEPGNAFKVFSNENTGFISAAEFRQILLSIGEKVSDDDIDDMIREADNGGGQIDCLKVVQLMEQT